VISGYGLVEEENAFQAVFLLSRARPSADSFRSRWRERGLA
jgi:hypothetical protein